MVILAVKEVRSEYYDCGVSQRISRWAAGEK